MARALLRLLRSVPARQAAIYFGSSSLRAGFAFLMLPVLAALLGPDGFGLWSLYRTLLLFMIPVLGLSLHASIGRGYHRLPAETMRRLIHTCLWFVTAAALLAWALTAPWLLTHDSVFSLPTDWLLLVPLVALLSNVTMVNQSLLRQQQRAWGYAAYELAGGLLPYLIGLALIWAGLGWTALVIGLLAASLCTALGSLWRFRREDQSRGPLDRALLLQTLGFTLPLIPHTLGMSMLVLSDRLVLERYSDPAEVGIYVVGYTLATGLQLVSLPFNNAWSPWVYRQLALPGGGGRLRVAKAYYLFAGGMLLLALAWWLLSPLVLELFFAAEFQAARPVLGWVVLGLLFAALHGSLFPILSDAGRSGALCLVTVSAVAVNLAGCFLLVPRHGMLGAAWATTAAYGLLFLGILVMVQRLTPLPWAAAARSLLSRRPPGPAA
jgi:O-antigen/teichoic acid export membrane protein